MKRWFISAYLAVLAALVVVAIYGLTQPLPWTAPAGLLLAAAAPLTFFIWLASARPARTHEHPVAVSMLSGLGAVIAMTAMYRYGDAYRWYLGGSIVALAGWMAYVNWYSRQPEAVGAPIPGEPLPELELEDADGNAVTTEALLGHAAVLVFYRGNWCPLCTAQIRELAAAWRKVARLNARLWFISSQPQKQTRQIAEQFSIPADFLRDPGNRAADKLGIAAPGAAPAGMEVLGYPPDAAMPTVIVVDAEGTVRFIEVARNYRLRPDPELYLKYLQPKTG
ncbi:MAG: peroxiredoxin family protein [Wenzhouxiangellaceae bacterium]|nr:peroxiredoxin family protein [Wenzhouxiangellaceae bacterium]